MSGGRLFSQRFGYGVHALAFCAKKPMGELTTLPELAEWMRSIWPSVSEAYLSRVVQALARGGLLQSHRGMGGGYSLRRPASDISLRDMAELLDGISLDPQRCGLSLEDRCPVQRRCSIQRRLAAVEKEFLERLETITVDQLAKEITVGRPQKKQMIGMG